MGQYNRAIITTAGENLIARAIVGEMQLNISKAKTSDHKYPDGTYFKDLTDMQGVKQVMTSPETKVVSGDMIQTRSLFSNEEIQSTYYIQNIGLYAMDGTQEVLFCIVTATTPDEMPQYNGVAATSYIYNIQNVVQDAETIHITVSTAGNATIQDVMERVDATGGDISETVIETLEPIDTKYPVPSAGESTKVFMGKVKKYIEDTKPLDADMFVYVAITGSNTTGDGTSSKPYETITYALSKIPKMLTGFTAAITVSGGAYNETVQIEGFTGKIEILLAGNVAVNGFNVIRSTVICRSSNTMARLLSVIYINVDSGRLDSFNNINFNITGFLADAPYASRNSSIFVSRGELYLSGTVNLFGNTDIGVAVATVSNAFIGTLIGTGLTMGKFITTGSQLICSKTNISASQADWLYSGVRVSPYGAVIGTLSAGAVIYVATTGSDTTGDGTSAKPYKTIQYAVGSLPRDLGSLSAYIKIADGTYPEDIVVNGFTNGSLYIERSENPQVVNTACNVFGVYCHNCTSGVTITGINFTRTDNDAVYCTTCSSITLWYCQFITTANFAGVRLTHCNGQVVACKVVGKKWGMIVEYGSNISSRDWAPGSTSVDVGLVSGVGSFISIGGNQPTGTVPRQVSYGGYFIYENGTQIGYNSSGLSCTWASLSGGYIRHGNASGAAMVTIQVHLYLPNALSAGSIYTITGFPSTPYVNVAVTSSPQNYVGNCYLELSGALRFTPSQNFAAGQYVAFNCTYLTNS